MDDNGKPPLKPQTGTSWPEETTQSPVPASVKSFSTDHDDDAEWTEKKADELDQDKDALESLEKDSQRLKSFYYPARPCPSVANCS
ncbi:hypothetical protein HDE_08361 [Halotydeus destructor]|nr:hypothetical protein HDE_08361 [Halotydeus destructor]